MGMPWFAMLVKIGAIAGISSVMLVLLYGQTRIFYTMARDGLLPSAFARVHPRFRTPWIDTIIVGVVAAGFAGLMSLDALVDLTNVGSLAAFSIVCLTVLYLRFAEPGAEAALSHTAFPVRASVGCGNVSVPADVNYGKYSNAQFLRRLPGGRHDGVLRLWHPPLKAGARRGRDRCRADHGSAA